jgi:hypothetical protein
MTSGCSHYKGAIPIDEKCRAQVKNDLVVGGILTRQAATKNTPSTSEEANKLLMKGVNCTTSPAQISSEDLALLLSGPSELSINAQYLRKMKQRLGHRFVMVGEQGGYPISKYLNWGIGWFIPAGPVIIFGSFPVTLSKEHDIQHAKRIIRVVDLDQARIIGESYEVLRDEDDGENFTSGQVSNAISSLKF